MELKKEITRDLIIVLAMLVILGLYFIIFPKNCKYNETCFNNAQSICKPAKFNSYQDGNLFEYRIIGQQAQDCIISLKLSKVSNSYSLELKNSFEGKDMVCTINRNQLKISPIQETSNLLSYCTGPLKEATLEFMIKRLYGAIAQKFGAIIKEIQSK